MTQDKKSFVCTFIVATRNTYTISKEICPPQDPFYMKNCFNDQSHNNTGFCKGTLA